MALATPLLALLPPRPVPQHSGWTETRPLSRGPGTKPQEFEGQKLLHVFVSQPCQGLGLQPCRSLIKGTTGGFPGGPVAKTPHSQCRWPGVSPWSGNYIPHAATKILCSQKKKKRNAQKCKSHCSHNSLSLWASDVTSRGVHSLVWKR